MARDRLAAIRERRAQGLSDPPSTPCPPRSPSPPPRTTSWAPSTVPPDSPRDFNPFAFQQEQAEPSPPSTPSQHPPRRRSSATRPPTAATGWFSGFTWGWNAASAPATQPASVDGAPASLRSPPTIHEQSPVLSYDSPHVIATDFVSYPYSPEADIPRDFNPNDPPQQPQPLHRPSISETLESPRSSVVIAPDLDVRAAPAATLPPAIDSQRHKRKISMVPLAPTQPYGRTIYEGDALDNEKYEMGHPNAAAQKEAATGQIGRDGRPRIQKGDVPHEEMSAFFEEITTLQQDLRRAHSLIQIIGSLRDRLLAIPSAESAIGIEVRDDLTAQTAAARELFTSIQTRLRILEQGNANLRVLIPAGQSLYNLSLQDVDVREQQVGLVKGRFKEVIHRYAETEREHRAKQRLRLERQIKVVNPSLPPEEVQALVTRAEDGESGAIFAQATTGYRSQAVRGALREVQTRAAELARIEQTLIELAQLFQDMAIMVEAQDVVIAEVEQTAAVVSHDMEKGVEQVQVAVKHARNARKFRWICFGLLVLILVILAIVLCATLIPPALRARNNNNNNTAPPPSPSASTA